MELHNGSIFLPKLAMHYDIIFRFCTFAALLMIVAAFEYSSDKIGIKPCPQ